MLQYTKIQKTISFVLIFSLLFNITLNFSFFNLVSQIFAFKNEHYNLVSIFVNEDVYDELKSDVKNYADNISSVLDNTKPLIIPVPNDATTYDIVKFNERLYTSGEYGLDGNEGNSTLIGTVLIGDIPLPVVSNDGSSSKTIFPYVDFEDKLYIYDELSDIYEINDDILDDPKAEIWHGVISPNTGNEAEDIAEIKAYLEKDDDFYNGEGLYQNENNITNGNESDEYSDEYKPQVFYYDQIREFNAISYINYSSYKEFLNNLEDIVYNRYSKPLANKLKAAYNSAQDSQTSSASELLGLDSSDTELDFEGVPDIQLSTVIKEYSKEFVEIFNEDTLGEFKKYVYNAGRYNETGTEVNVDMVPSLISNLDVFYRKIIKSANTDLEDKILDIVNSGLARNIAIPTTYITDAEGCGYTTYTNFFNGTLASDISLPEECSIYRGTTDNSGTLVESNRGYNINNVEGDVDLCLTNTSGRWGGNSPVNLDTDKLADLDYVLKSANTNKAIYPIFDIEGSVESTDSTKNPSVDDCFNQNFILTQKHTLVSDYQGHGESSTTCELTLNLPTNSGSTKNWSCSSTNTNVTLDAGFEKVYKELSNLSYYSSCVVKKINIDGAVVLSKSGYCNNSGENNETPNYYTYNYHKITSVGVHTSPTSEELSAETQNMVTPSLPVNKDRYVEFISADDTYDKIKFPYLFRLDSSISSGFTKESIKADLKTYLDEKSQEINSIINSYNPSKLTGEDKEIYDVLKTGSYPSANVDLYSFLNSKSSQNITNDLESKTVTYIDLLTEAIYWNNLNTTTSKYSYVFSNYLSDQFKKSDNVYLPKNKKSYEIAYIGAAGDSKSMYIKMDPEDKGDNPYSDIVSKNQEQTSLLSTVSSNTSSSSSSSSSSCAPPEGVSLIEWLPAVTCRLKEMLPPKISITDGSCGTSYGDYVSYGDVDEDEDGVNDYYLEDFINGYVSLTSDYSKYYYNKSGKLYTRIYNEEDGQIYGDSYSTTRFEISKIVDKETGETVYDSENPVSDDQDGNISKYVTFKNSTLNSVNGENSTAFTTKSKDADLYFTTKVYITDSFGEVLAEQDDEILIEVRGDILYSQNYKLYSESNIDYIDTGISTLEASDKNNLFISTKSIFDLQKDNIELLKTYSLSDEKMFLSLDYRDKNGDSLDIEYPINLELYDEDDELIYSNEFSSITGILPITTLKTTGIYNLVISDSNGSKIQKELQVTPKEVETVKLDLGTQLLEKDGVITTNLFSLYDEYGNITAGDLYDIELSIDGDSVVFEDDETSKTYTLIEGYKTFRLKSTDDTGISKINLKVLKDGEEVLNVSEKLKVVDKINFEVTGDFSDVTVGENVYSYNVEVEEDPDFSFSSRAYLISDELYYKSLDDVVDIENNKATGRFITTTKSGENISLEFKVEGVKDSVYKEINIYPELPVSVDLSLTKSKIEANGEDKSVLTATLKDRFSNTVWNDNTTVLTYSLNEKYKNIIGLEDASKTASKGVATFDLTGYPDSAGTAFFQVSTTPSLENNSASIQTKVDFSSSDLDYLGLLDDGDLSDEGTQLFYTYSSSVYRLLTQDESSLNNISVYSSLSTQQKEYILSKLEDSYSYEITGVGENVGKIETYFSYDKDVINGNSYNAIYTTLLGASYGDVTVEDYLAGSMIFDDTSRALGVTTLLNNGINTDDVLEIKPSGNLSLNTDSSDLSKNIETYFKIDEDKKLNISFVNTVYSQILSRVIYNLKSNNLETSRCLQDSIYSCLAEDKSSLTMKVILDGYKTRLEDGILYLLDDDNNKLLSIDENGNFLNKSSYLTFDLNSNYGDLLVLNLNYNSQTIGILGISINDSSLNYTRSESNISAIKTAQSNGGLVVYMDDRSYSLKTDFLGNSTDSQKGYIIYANSDISSDSYSLDKFSEFFDYGYENYYSEGGIGWEGSNKSLLSFSAGESIGESTKEYQTFSLINIGDPVISLKSRAIEFSDGSGDKKYDATIGNIISKDDDNLAFQTLDYNKDGNDDIVILKDSGVVELVESNGNGFDNGVVIAQLADYSQNEFIETGDFDGDGYWDILLYNDDKDLILLDNKYKKLTRINLSEKLNLKGNISQVVSDFIDGDDKSDIVVFDDSGEINIFYGSLNSDSIYKKLVSTGNGVQLDSSSRNDNSLIYFDGLYQIPEDDSEEIYSSSEELYAQIQSNLSTGASTDEEITVSDDLINGLLFEQGTYSTSDGIEATAVIDVDDLDSLEENSTTDDVTTFLKTEYADYEGLKVSKTYTNITNTESNLLKSGDSIYAEIEITNNSDEVKNNIVFLEEAPEVFYIGTSPNYKMYIDGEEKNFNISSSPISGYDFLLDSYYDETDTYKINLQPGSTLKITYNLRTNSFTYGSIKVGEFDDTDSDKDIIFKTDSKSCGDNYDLYYSISGYRSYIGEAEVKTLSCNNDFPEEIQKNTIDEDGNGVPDYIDELIDTSNTNNEALEEYSENALNDLYGDSDGDGISDYTDISPNYDDDSSIFDNLDSINETTDDVLEGMDTLTDGFGCGFGGGSCISSPMNWAPLAPGNDPTLFGIPVGDGLRINEGIPIFSMMNWTPAPPPVFCMPMPWPAGGYFAPGCVTGGAGGLLGVVNPTNVLRIFVTPTITGAVGTAICFGQPLVAGLANPPGAHPLVSGGNCIVVAMPLVGCSSDGSDGDVSSDLIPTNTIGDTSITNGNCGSSSTSSEEGPVYIGDLAETYLYSKNNNSSIDDESFNEKLEDLVYNGGSNTSISLPNEPLLSLGDESDENFSVSVDMQALKDGNFSDVLQVSMSRVSAFPDFVMEWVTRQIEEIATKLTSFPTIFIVLPDFSGILDSGWSNFKEQIEEFYNAGKNERSQEVSNLESRITALENQKSTLGCNAEEIDSTLEIKCLKLQVEIDDLNREKNYGGNETLSGIRSVYQFLSTLPLLSIEAEEVDVNIPWADQATLDRAVLNWELTKKQWSEEIDRFADDFALDNYTCIADSTDNSNECNIWLKSQDLLDSLDRNIEILEDYKELPEKIHKMLKIKEVRLEQILCNIETISQLVSGWISTNAKIFKSWIELYVLIKAILKSWQLLIDIFIDYEEECHQCKNERSDLMYYIWKLISAAIPQIPVIQFPKWPDIYIDLHNVRAGLTIFIPDFQFNLRPLVLPTLPKLILPSEINVQINLPTLPTLPTIELPELPELPSLPSVELPNLPPAPTLPKLFSSIEGFLNILKIITKAMCILKTSPFVPEWRAGDQIAFMTERSGYLDFDFLDISLPQFSYPFIDAIKVTSYVNFEYETDYLVELASTSLMPFNTFTNNIVNMLNIGVDDLDFSSYVPTDVNIDISTDGSVEGTADGLDLTGYNWIKPIELVKYFALGIINAQQYMTENSQVELTASEFKKEVLSQLSSESITSNQKLLPMIEMWNNVAKYDYTAENKVIDDLLEYNRNKFDTVYDIIYNEKSKNEELIENLEDILNEESSKNKLISSNNKNSDFDLYNSQLQKYNNVTVENFTNLSNPDLEVGEIKEQTEKIEDRMISGLVSFNDEMLETGDSLLAEATTTSDSDSSSSTCSTSGYSYDYEGLFITEGTRSYRLFSYLDELDGDEQIEFKEDEVYYMVGNELFYKKALQKEETNKKLDYEIINDFVELNQNYAMVNGFNQTVIKSNYVNIGFNAPTNPLVRNFNLELYDVYDKFEDYYNGLDENYEPTSVDKTELDLFTGYDDGGIDFSISNEDYIFRNNLSYISNISDLFGVTLTTKELQNIREYLEENNLLNISSNTKIYAGNDGVKITYYYSGDEDKVISELTIPKYENLQFENNVVITSINGDAYITTGNDISLTGNEISEYVKKPLFDDTTITYTRSEFTSESSYPYIRLKHYDGTQRILNFEEVVKYQLKDLGDLDDYYSVLLEVDNGYYYSKIRSFKDGNYSNYSNKVLISPQKESDQTSPEISDFSISVGIYEKKQIDITDYIYEDNGFNNIKEVAFDFDLDTDTSGDMITDNDKYFTNKVVGETFNIKIANKKILLDVGEFKELQTKTIRLFVTDGNDNVGVKDVTFEVYEIKPEITQYSDETLYGEVDGDISSQIPINLYRYRGGGLTKLQDIDGEYVPDMNENLNFNFKVDNTSSGLTLKEHDNKIFDVNEETGLIKLSQYANLLGNITFRVLSSNDENNEYAYPLVKVYKSGVEIFSQYLKISDVGQVNVVDDFSGIEDVGVYYSGIDDDYNEFVMPLSLENNAGDMFIYSENDTSKNPLAVIFKDGRINLLSSNLRLDYSDYGDYIVYNIVNKTTNLTIGRLMLVPEKSYILK